jgi:hypothetical protein
MSPTHRDEFSQGQINALLAASAQEVARRWPTVFQGMPPHYLCEHCEFVSGQRNHFEVDHILPCARGGTGDRVSDEDAAAIAALDLEAICRIGINQQLLCYGCNQAKKARQFIPPGAGYAYCHPEWDRNPDHIYNGRPTVSKREREEHPEPYDPRRYS